LCSPSERNYRRGLGSIRAMGEHKGSGLAFMCEILGGALTGGGCAGPGARSKIANGMLSIYMSPAVFGSANAFAEETRGYVEFFKSSRPDHPGGEVLAPGEPERRARAKRLKEGVPLETETWDAIRKTALGAGLTEEHIQRILE
jgi:uncharacterized oxidoreductase